MPAVTASLSMLLIAAGVVVLLVSSSRGLSLRVGVPMMLDLWVAAGLLKLAGNPSWQPLAMSAGLIVVRKLIVARMAVAPPNAGM